MRIFTQATNIKYEITYYTNISCLMHTLVNVYKRTTKI